MARLVPDDVAERDQGPWHPSERASRLEMNPYRLHVQGTAGSGKTQLAVQELKRAQAMGQRSLYVCFNRALADAMQQSVPAGAKVVTLHEMGREFLDNEPDDGDPCWMSAEDRTIERLGNLCSHSAKKLIRDIDGEVA